jgi:RNase P subunit RPR2
MAKNPVREDDIAPLICARCTRELQPGKETSYRIMIEAVADPTPAEISKEELEGDLRQRIERLIRAMGDLSEREAMDQVYRRLTLYLCAACYRIWIENPAGE